jgi:hypothetical protein
MNDDTEWKQYSKRGHIEAQPWEEGFDMSKVKSKEEPEEGDYIARDPRNRDDMWLIKRAFFDANYEAMDFDRE